MTPDNLTFWQNRTAAHAKRYWDTRAEPYRGLLADALRALAPFTSVLEVGCHSGPNLWALRQRWPDVKLIGVDPSRDVLGYGVWAMSAKPSEGGLGDDNVEFFEGYAPSCFEDFPSVDVVVSCYTLAYIAPAQIDAVMTALLASATKGVVLVEPGPDQAYEPFASSPMPVTAGKIQPYYHDYLTRLQQGGCSVVQRTFPGPDNLNRIWVATR